MSNFVPKCKLELCHLLLLLGKSRTSYYAIMLLGRVEGEDGGGVRHFLAIGRVIDTKYLREQLVKH